MNEYNVQSIIKDGEKKTKIQFKDKSFWNDINHIDSDKLYEESHKLYVTSSPHVFSKNTTQKIMLDVLIALLLPSIAAVILFGLNAFILIAVCVVSAVFSEWAFQKITKQKVVISDLSAAVTGLLLALNLPSTVPWWQGMLGSIIAVVVVKGLFGGIGKNFANPAITARIILLISFGATIGASSFPTITDVNAQATPLAILKQYHGLLPEIWQMLVGLRGGAIGEGCIIALLIGGIYLMIRKIITWHTPVVFIGTVFVLTAIIYQDVEIALYEILSGGLFIGAFFMATDYATTPSRPWGKVIFAFGCGLITVVIRVWGNLPEGVSYSILFMNILTPYIEKWAEKRPFGGNK